MRHGTEKVLNIGEGIVLPGAPQEGWYNAVMSWAKEALDRHNGMEVRANADTGYQIEQAVLLGAKAVGMVRTEQMLEDSEAHEALRNVIIGQGSADSMGEFKQKQKEALNHIFTAGKQANGSFPINIRLLDAPTAEFLSAGEAKALEESIGKENMRGVQLGLRFPKIYRAQIEAVFEAANEVGYQGPIEIMVPLVKTADELTRVKEMVEEIAAAKNTASVPYRFGAMIETTEAVDIAADLAQLADFFCFGTYDLTKAVIGIADLNDVSGVEKWCKQNGHVGRSPKFTIVDPVAEKMKQASEAAREANPSIEIRNVGRQMGDRDAVMKSRQAHVTSVSIPPREDLWCLVHVSAAQSAIERSRGKAGEQTPIQRL